MIYPSIDKLLTKVDSKYKLVYIASKRSSEIKHKNHLQMKNEEYIAAKPLGRALEEINKGLIKYN